jgi:hypothetical protein
MCSSLKVSEGNDLDRGGLGLVDDEMGLRAWRGDEDLLRGDEDLLCGGLAVEKGLAAVVVDLHARNGYKVELRIWHGVEGEWLVQNVVLGLLDGSHPGFLLHLREQR